MIQFMPDWSKLFTKEQSEKELIGFKFRGTGWYFTKVDTMLVAPYGNSDKLFQFFIWNHPSIGQASDGSPTEALNWAINAATRLDLRIE